jgi:hypothetical protein
VLFCKSTCYLALVNQIDGSQQFFGRLMITNGDWNVEWHPSER